MKKQIIILCAVLFLMLLLPLRITAAGVGDVYAALRDIGVPEEYIAQGAGLLARGTSDGAGVYRSDGTYYSYSDMVSYIYANRELILAYCCVDDPAETTALTTGTGISAAAGTGITAAPAPVTTVLSTQTTVPTSASVTLTVAVISQTQPTEITRSAVDSDTDAEKPSGWIAAAALCCIAGAFAGFAGLFRCLKKQESA